MTSLVAFDADVLIYAASPNHPLGRRVLERFTRSGPGVVGVGSLLLLTEVLSKPMRDDENSLEAAALLGLLARLDLIEFDQMTAHLSLTLSVSYGLRAADAAHLATAVAAGADYFLTNNKKDFPKTITEVDVIYPEDLPLD